MNRAANGIKVPNRNRIYYSIHCFLGLFRSDDRRFDDFVQTTDDSTMSYCPCTAAMIYLVRACTFYDHRLGHAAAARTADVLAS